MKHTLKKSLAIILAAATLLCCAPLSGFVGLELPEFGGFKKLALSVSDFFDGFATKAEAATSGSCGDNLTWSFDESTGELVINGTGNMKDWTYSSWTGSTNAPWSLYKYDIKKVTIGNDVTSIGDRAFFRCASLTSITIPDSITSIGDSAFYECAFLTSITIGNGVTNIGESVFFRCTNLTSIEIPDSVTSIGDDAFYDCTSLTSITIPESVTNIGRAVFYSCVSLISITIPDRLTIIGDYAFYNCDSLTSVTIPDSVTIIGNDAFRNCDSLTSVVIPDSVTIIGDFAFGDCTSLTSITIPDSVTSIGYSAFCNCLNLTNIEIPDTDIYIGAYAFKNTNYYNSEYNWMGQELYIGNHLIKVKTSAFGNYTIKKNGVRTIASGAFYKCDDVTDIIIPNGVTIIGDGAFSECDKLTSISIPNSVTHIGTSAFFECKWLTSITLPSGIKEISDGMFIRCYSLFKVDIPDTVTYIGNNSFYECNSLTSISLGNGVTHIDDYAFGYCYRLTSVSIPCSVFYIGENVFVETNLTNIYYAGTETMWKSIAGSENINTNVSLNFNYTGDINLTYGRCGDNVTYCFNEITNRLDITGSGEMQNYSHYDYPFDDAVHAFWDNSRIETVNIDEGVKTIGSWAFRHSGITNLSIGYGVTVICDGAFYECTKLTDVIIPNSVSYICADAFSYCTSLKSLTIPNSVELINGAFYGCSNITDIYYTGTEEEWNLLTAGDGNEEFKNAVVHFGSIPKGERLSIVSTTPSDNGTILIADNDLIFNFDRRFTSIKDGFEITISYDLNQKKITDENSNYKIEGSNLRIIDAFAGIPTQKQCYIKIKKFDAYDENKNVIYPFYGMASDEYIEVYLCDTIADSGYSQDHVIYDYTTRNEKYIDDKLDSLAVPMDGTNGNPDFCVPGQGEDMIPQGLAYYEEKNWLLISSYNKVEKGDEDKQKNSVIFALDYDTGEFVAQFNLLHDDKSPFKGHVGGIAVSEHNLYITRGSGIAYIPLSELDVPEGAVKEIAIADKKNFAQLKKDDKADTESASCSYIDCTDGVLWAGNFYSFSGSVVTFNEGWRIPASKKYNSVLLGFKLSGNTSEEEWKSINRKSADYYVGIPNSVECIQGVAAKEIGNEKYQVFFSRTTGASFTTTISVITLDFSRNKTAYPKKKNFVEINNLPGAENVVINDGDLYCVYESAALDEYGKLLWNKNVKDTTDVVWRFDLSQILSIERYLQMFNCPIDIEVYEKDSGKLVGRTVNNVVDETLEDKNVVVEVYGETKYLWTPANKEYTVKIIGNGDGKMDYSIIKYGSNLEETERANFYDISITKGKEIIGELSAENFDISQYKLTMENGTVYPSDSFKNSDKQFTVNVVSDIDGAAIETFEAVAGDFVTVQAPDVNGLIFAGWYIDNKAVSSEKEYGFVIKHDTNITAKFLEMSIRNPSTTTISYGDSIILHADIDGELTAGYTVQWTASNGNFSYKANGATCTISPEKSGSTTFTATIYDADGNPVSTDEQTMTSKAGFFDKIIAFFKKLFGLTKTYPDIFGI